MGTSPRWLLVTLSQLNLGQGLKPALDAAAEAGEGTSPLCQVYSDALHTHSVRVHTTKPTLGEASRLQTSEPLLKSQATACPMSRGFWIARRSSGQPLGGSGTAGRASEGLCKLKASSSISSRFPGCSHSILEGLQEAWGGQPSKQGGHSQTTQQKQSAAALTPRDQDLAGRAVVQKEVLLSWASLCIPSFEFLGPIRALCQGQCWATATLGTIGNMSWR